MNNKNIFSSPRIEDVLHVQSNGDIGIGTTLPNAKLHVDQSSSTNANPVLSLDQADIDQEFINFIGSSSGDLLNPITTLANGTTTGHFRISINGVDRYVPFVTTPTA